MAMPGSGSRTVSFAVDFSTPSRLEASGSAAACMEALPGAGVAIGIGAVGAAATEAPAEVLAPGREVIATGRLRAPPSACSRYLKPSEYLNCFFHQSTRLSHNARRCSIFCCPSLLSFTDRSEERRVGKECRSR